MGVDYDSVNYSVVSSQATDNQTYNHNCSKPMLLFVQHSHALDLSLCCELVGTFCPLSSEAGGAGKRKDEV